MAKRVFEVAKDLGVDHRELMKKCDELGIEVRNYMSSIQDEDAQKLKALLAGSSGAVEEQVSAPGVRRRRRPGEATTARVVSGKEPESDSVKPKTNRRPGAGISPAADATEAKQAAERKQIKAEKEAAEAAKAEKQLADKKKATVKADASKAVAKASTEAPVSGKSEEKPKAEKADDKSASKAASTAKIVALPETSAAKTNAPTDKAAKPAVHKTAEVKAEKPVEPKAEKAAPEKTEVAPATKEVTKPDAAKSEKADAAKTSEADKSKTSVTAPSSFKGPIRKPVAVRPIAPKAEEDAKPAQAADGVTRRQPQKAREGAAKILGVIPIEQLRDRTRQAQVRRGPGGNARPANRSADALGGGASAPTGRAPSRPAGTGAQNSSGPGGFRSSSNRGPSAPSRNVGMPFPPVAPPPDKPGTRRRSVSKNPNGGTGGDLGAERPSRSSKSASRKRQISHEELYSNLTDQPTTMHHRPRRKTKVASRKHSKTLLTKPSAKKRIIRVDDTISVGELGREMGVKASELIRKLMQMGTMATVNQQLDIDTAALLAGEYEWEVKNIAFHEENVLSSMASSSEREQDPDAVWRAPVVTVMGHVDHGKTTLLDRIRKANVATGEAGGITQHIGAYRVETPSGPVVFLDTPGHAAFTAMRARGASVTDLVVLVVAADDGVMPQTVESINHARAAGVPIIVAINKVDKQGADPERIKRELTKYELVAEEWGGDVMCVPVSALKSEGITKLLECLALQAEVLDLKANPKKEGFGTVIEARVDKGRGNVCTVLVQDGTLHAGDFIVSGAHFGRVRAMINDRGKRLKEAGPSTPVEVLGLGGLPSAGDTFHVVASERDARRVAESRDDKERSKRQATKTALNNASELLASLDKQDREKQALILKTDVAGSLEAIRASLEQLSTDEVEVQIVHSAVGGINESDITLAQAAGAVIIGFNTSPDGNAKRAADQVGVKIIQYSVIYDLIDGVKDLMSGHLAPEMVENFLGRAEVRAVFHVAKLLVAGCYVTEGKIQRNMLARVHRGKELIAEGKIVTLKRFKEDAREVASGYECGLHIDGYKDVQEQDIIECFEQKLVKRSIDGSHA